MDIDYCDLLFDMKNTSELLWYYVEQMIEIIKTEKIFWRRNIKIENNKELDSDEMIKNIEEIKKYKPILNQFLNN